MPSRDDVKRAVCEGIDRRSEKIVKVGETIRKNPELGFKEFKTSRLAEETMREIGLEPKGGLALTGVRGVAGGTKDGPAFALLGEPDGLVVAGHPVADPQTGVAHACGHNGDHPRVRAAHDRGGLPVLPARHSQDRALHRGRVMKHLPSVLLMAVCLLVPAAYADEKEETAKAHRAATAWLALTDGGKYSESWESSAALFKAAITKLDWEKAVKSARFPLGALKSRKLKSATFTRRLPGAPDGEYVVIQFDAQFENKAAAIETVTPMREKDGSWRVSGYYIK